MIEVRTKIRKKGGGSGSPGGFGASVLSQIADIQASAFTQLTGLRTLLVPVDESGAELSYAEAEKAVALKSKLDFFSERNVSALGMTGEPGEGGGGGLDVEELAQYLAEKGYATQEWVNSRGFLTYHQSLADYLTRSEAAGLYQPKGNYVAYGRQTLATANGTNLMPQFINIENENLIAGYKNYWNVINLGSYSRGNFRSQIAMPYQEDIADTDIFIRTSNNTVWRPWRRLLHDGNFASVLDSAYLRLSGGTMANTNLVTNLNADLLDGHHASDFNPLRYIGSNTDAHNAYVVLCQAYNDEGGNGINGGMFNGMVYIERGGFWASVKKTAVMIQCGGQYLNNVANYQILSDLGGGVTGLYKIIYNGKAYIALGSSLWNGSYFYVSGMWTEQPFVINDDDAGITSSTLLNGTPQIESNAKSATRLLNTRTLWGQSFDGSGNVSGTLSGVSGIAFTYSDGVDFDAYGNIHFRTSTGSTWSVFADAATTSPILSVRKNERYVGIGTTAPTAKLHVNGTGLFSGELSLGSHLQVYNTIYFKQTGAYLENSNPDRLSLNWRTNGNWETTPFVFNKSGNMSASGEVQSSGANAFRAICGGYGFIIRNDSLNVHFMLTNSGNASGGYNDLRPLYISCASGDVYVGNAALIARHVTGDVEVRRNIVATGNIACLGAVTEASELEDIYQRLARLENEVF